MPSPIRKMQQRRRRRWRAWHVGLGSLALLPLLVIVGTGILLGFYDPLRFSQAPYALAHPVASSLTPAQLAERVQARYPERRLRVLYLPVAAHHAARAVLDGAGGRRLVFLHPGSGAPLAMQSAGTQDWLGFIYQLHRGKPLGLAGQIIASLSGVAVGLLWGLGWYLRRRRRSTSCGRGLRLHRWCGFYVGGFLALGALLGALLNFAGPLLSVFNPPPAAPARLNAPLADWTRVIAAGQAAYSGARLERIYFPAAATAPWQLRFQDGGRVFLTARGPTVLQLSAPLSHWTSSLYPLHSGRILGPYGPMAMSLLGAAGLLLLLSVRRHWRLPGWRRPGRRLHGYAGRRDKK